MNLFLIVPEEGQASELAAQLAKTVGASRISPHNTMAILALIGGADGTFPRWSLLKIPSAELGRLTEISQFVSQQVEANGMALVDLDERLISVAELQEAALGLGLDVELVAIVKHKGKEPSSLTPPYNAVMDALAALGGRCVSTGQIARHLGVRHDIIRRRLALLVQWRRIVQEGQKGGISLLACWRGASQPRFRRQGLMGERT